MFNISEIIQAAHGGAAIDNLAQQFGLSPEQAKGAVDALIPALSSGLQSQAADAGTLGDLVNQVAGDSIHKDSFSDPAAAFSDAASAQGSNSLTQIFGSGQTVDNVVQHAAQVSGVSPQILQQMFPALLSIVLGGLSHSMQTQGLGGILGQLAGAAANGGLGNLLGQTGGIGGVLGGLLGGLFGGSRTAPAAQAASPPANDLQAGLDQLSKMLQPGIHVPQAQQQALADIMGQSKAS